MNVQLPYEDQESDTDVGVFSNLHDETQADWELELEKLRHRAEARTAVLNDCLHWSGRCPHWDLND